MKKRELKAAEVELKALREANDYKDRLIAVSKNLTCLFYICLLLEINLHIFMGD